MKVPKGFLLALMAVLLVCNGDVAAEDGSLEGLPLDTAAEEDGGIGHRGARILGLLLLVALVCYGTMQWNRRRGRTHDAAIRILAVKPLGQREKVAIMEVLGERMVLGVTAHRISLLSQGPSRFSEYMPGKDSQE
jgi:flagellar biogenesis protein FliO